MLTEDDLVGLRWRFIVGGQTVARSLQLLRTGRIAGYRHPNERYWQVDGDGIALLNIDRGLTARLSRVSEPGAPIRYGGVYTGDPSISFELEGREPEAWPEFGSATRQQLAAQIAEKGWEIGAHSYGRPSIIDSGLARFSMGRFCSVAEGVTITLDDHKLSNVSTYPFHGLRWFWPSCPGDAVDHSTRGDVVIGNDVWIGAGAFIGSGVTIGDGAVIGAGAVVSRDAPPYSVMLGVPAKPVRYRFRPETIAALLEIRWWDWPEPWIDAAMPLIVSEDIDAFVRLGLRKPTSLEDLVALVDEALDPPVPPGSGVRAGVRSLLGRVWGRSPPARR